MKEYQKNKNRILVVDDEPEIVDLLTSYLSAKGYEVTSACSGEEALNILQGQNEDIMLLDIKMPGMQGTEVARIVKEKYPDIKIIIVTAYTDETGGLAENNLISGLFEKPIKMEKLYQKIMEVLHCSEIKILVTWVKTVILLAIKNTLPQNYKNN